MAIYPQGTPIEINDNFSNGGVATNPTTLTYSILGPDGVVVVYDLADPEVVNNAVGSYTLFLPAPTFPGDYQYDVDATGAVTASRSGTFTVLPFRAVPGDVPWAVVGPCNPWVDSQSVWDCCGQPMTTIGEGSMEVECPVDMTNFSIEASQLLFELSGRIFSGQCEKTVRPCATEWCGFQVLSRGHVIGPWDWGGWGWTGSSWNWPNSSSCGCWPLSRVKLSGYPVRSITEVKIDGVVISPTEYRLDERRWLTRMADADGNVQWWPACQRLDLDDTEVGTFAATYRYGLDPPLVGIHAAQQLACELYRACTGSGECQLPTGTTRVTRQGITISRTAFQRDRTTGIWATGLNLVDAFLASYNPSGLTRRPTFWAPGGHRYARTVGS